MRWLERYFYKPSVGQKILAFILLPFSFLYCAISTIKRKIAPFRDFRIPIVSIGNLVVGGSGKTPFVIEIAKDYENACVILRGYKRKSKGVKIVSIKGEIKESVESVGDEALMIARALKNASVIVSENRAKGILEAKKLGANVIFLDDGFRFNFKKLNIVLKPKLEPYFSFCIPSGAYREKRSAYKKADIVAIEGVDYKRSVQVVDSTPKMLLLTAIANPSRLDEFLPSVVGKILLSDHAFFPKEQILEEYKRLGATSLLITQKDAPKLDGFELPLSKLQLNLEINPQIKEKIRVYIKSHKTS